MGAVVLRGDARHLPLPDGSVDLVVTSPPYFGLRSYTDGGEHYSGQIGSEATPAEWLAAMVECTAEWVRVLKPSGSIFVNLGDKYAGNNQDGRSRMDPNARAPGIGGGMSAKWRQPKAIPLTQDGARHKSLLGLPWRYAIACTDQLGLILRRDIIWNKPNGLPESVTDRCRSSHEYLFHLVKQPRYYAAVDEIREPHAAGSISRIRYAVHDTRGANRSRYDRDGVSENVARDLNPLGKLPGSVWTIPSQPLTVPARLGIDHFAAFPMELPRRCILGWSPPGVCTGCGEGRRPVADTTLTHDRKGMRQQAAADAPRGGKQNFAATTLGRERFVTITGYACACPQPDAPARPAVVLDPFGGTGTTALVAAMHGRTGISVDMSADYCRLAQWRTQDPAERARAMDVPKPPPVPDGMEPLFAI